MAYAVCIVGIVMIIVVVSSSRFGVNPDNVATPIAASLGDLVTLFLLANIVNVSKSVRKWTGVFIAFPIR